jgi:hypothetical protein
MSEQETKRPSHRISFAAFEQDREGKSKLGNAREIGAIWPRDGKDGESILRFDHTPIEKGVYFVREANASEDDRPRVRKRETERER